MPAATRRRSAGGGRGGSLIGRCARTHGATIATSRRRAGTDLVTLLTQAPLVRINRATDEIEPWLAERWTASADGRTYTLTLRAMTFSDGAPFTSADVLFAFEAIYDDARQEPAEVGARSRRAAAAGLRSRRVDRGDHRSRRRSVPDCGSSTTCRSCPSTSSAAALAAGTFAAELDAGPAARHRRGPRARSSCANTRPANGWSSGATRTTSAATPRARRCRTSIRSRCVIAPIRRRRRCACREARST